MMKKQVKKNRVIRALEVIHTALKPLSPEDRQRTLASVYALLEIAAPAHVESVPQKLATEIQAPSSPGLVPQAASRPQASRPVGVAELISDKKPRNNAQLIAVFAYYREKYQNALKFSRDDLHEYFALGRVPKPANFHRDFVEAVKKGWIHEDGENSYITSKGLEAVESGFAGRSEPASQRRKHRRAGKS